MKLQTLLMMCNPQAIYSMCRAEWQAENHTFQPLQKEAIPANLMICICINSLLPVWHGRSRIVKTHWNNVIQQRPRVVLSGSFSLNMKTIIEVYRVFKLLFYLFIYAIMGNLRQRIICFLKMENKHCLFLNWPLEIWEDISKRVWRPIVSDYHPDRDGPEQSFI